jgi:hypothetical protein
MLSFKQYIREFGESPFGYKGWVNPRTKKMHLHNKMSPYHVEMIASDPKKYGLDMKKIIAELEKEYDGMDAPEPDKDARKAFRQLAMGTYDVHRGVEQMAMKKGWVRVIAGGDFGEISGVKMNERLASKVLNMLEDSGKLGKELKAIYIQDYRGPFEDVREKSIKVLEGDAIRRLIQGKSTGKRTEIGATMAMFR